MRISTPKALLIFSFIAVDVKSESPWWEGAGRPTRWEEQPGSNSNSDSQFKASNSATSDLHSHERNSFRRQSPRNDVSDWDIDYDERSFRQHRQHINRQRGVPADNQDFFMEDEGEEGPYVRTDLVSEYALTAKGNAIITIGSAFIGAAFTALVSELTIKHTSLMAFAGIFLGLILNFSSGAFGDLTRALGLGLYLTVCRSIRAESQYPITPQLRSVFHLAPRNPFPPVNDDRGLWSYVAKPGEIEFNMSKTLLSLSLLGAVVGYFVSKMIFFLPEAMGAVIVGGCVAYCGTFASATGDFLRLTGAKATSLFEIISSVDQDVMAWEKAMVVGQLCLAKLLFWNKKYRVTQKASEIVSSAVAKARSSTEKDDLSEDFEYAIPRRQHDNSRRYEY